jgi:hypothetical protein
LRCWPSSHPQLGKGVKALSSATSHSNIIRDIRHRSSLSHPGSRQPFSKPSPKPSRHISKASAVTTPIWDTVQRHSQTHDWSASSVEENDITAMRKSASGFAHKGSSHLHPPANLGRPHRNQSQSSYMSQFCSIPPSGGIHLRQVGRLLTIIRAHQSLVRARSSYPHPSRVQNGPLSQRR